MLQATARLLKARHERTRNRTRERALLHMEQLLEALAAHPASSTRPQPGTTAAPCMAACLGTASSSTVTPMACLGTASSSTVTPMACLGAVSNRADHDLMLASDTCSLPAESDSRGADGGASKGSQGEGQQASSSGSRNLTNTHLPYAYDCWFPLRVHLRKELAEHYMSMGFVGAWNLWKGSESWWLRSCP
eukprot:1144571-Pelagomonas_calceolata.AAC.3